jgi:nucleoside permease NupC
MDKQEREFARNQTDIEIALAICLGLLALAGAFLIAYAEMGNSVFYYLTFAFGVSAILCAVGALLIRRKMDEPKEGTKTTILISTMKLTIKNGDKELEAIGMDTETVDKILKSWRENINPSNPDQKEKPKAEK